MLPYIEVLPCIEVTSATVCQIDGAVDVSLHGRRRTQVGSPGRCARRPCYHAYWSRVQGVGFSSRV
jgi:hypothetical protein